MNLNMEAGWSTEHGWMLVPGETLENLAIARKLDGKDPDVLYRLAVDCGYLGYWEEETLLMLCKETIAAALPLGAFDEETTVEEEDEVMRLIDLQEIRWMALSNPPTSKRKRME